ncbi:beta-ketoacyl-ACP synthase III [Prochlorothrix hollandica]|uniref:beta-ketoacyl-ACP synthase III n=1 Tax=Prochlorothrix hollandica TaxID=1223 RepID=UPI00389A0874
MTGSGSAVPDSRLTNQDLSNVVETSDEWIRTRTGIRERCLASPTDSLGALATAAAHQALEQSGVAAIDLDLIVLATSTADDLFGSAAVVQANLGATHAAVFDLTAACSGFIFAMVTAAQFIQTGTYRRVLVIGADVLSRWVDWDDRGTCVLFGDGAGAVVMQAHDSNQFLGFELCSNGSLNSCLNLAYAAEAYPLHPKATVSKGRYSPVTMNGKEVYRFAVNRVPEVIEKALFRANVPLEQVDWFVLHQANQRILDAVADRLKIPPEKMLSNLASYGNTSAASIPLVIHEAVQAGKIQPGQTLATAGFGAGLSWGSAIFRWGLG